MADQHLPSSNIQTDQSPYPFWALERFIRGFGSGFLIVADQAELATKDGENGQHAFSLKARTEWIADPTDTGVAVPNERIAMPSGGFWIRTQYADAKWRAKVDAPGVPAWTINALAGDDEADGSPATPIKTHAELGRRIGNFGQWVLPGQVTITYTSIAAMPPNTDPLPLDDGPLITTPPPGGTPIFLTIQGPAPAVKAGHGGLITAVTARVRATNTPWKVTTTGTLDGTDVGLRLQITTGPRAGAVTFVDRVTGANQVETSEWEITDLTPTTFADTHVTPSNAGADTTQVFTQGTLFVRSLRMRGGGGTSGSIQINDLDIAAPNAGGEVIEVYASGGGINFQRCRFLDSTAFYGETQETNGVPFLGLIYLLNCFQSAKDPSAVAGNNMLFHAGDYQSNIINGGLYHGAVIASQGSLQWDADAMATGGAVGATQGGFIIVGAGSSYRAPATGGFDVGDGSLLRATTLFYGVAAVYGQGNAAAGVLIAGRMTYDSAPVLAGITVAGPPGVDFILGAAATSFFFDPATGAYAPAGGLASTWANMAAAQPGGLGGEAHNPRRSIDLVQASPLTFP